MMTTEDTEDTEAVNDPNHHMNAALEAVAEVARKLKQERDEALAVIKALRVNAREDLAKLTRERDEARESVRMLWEIAEVGLDDLSDEQLELVDRSWGVAEK